MFQLSRVPHRRVLLSALVMGVCMSAGAQVARPAAGAATPDATLAPESVFFDEVPMVLTATRLRQSLSETPGAVSIIDRDMIRLSGAREVPDVLRLLPGFQVSHYGSFPMVGYHGLSGNRSNRLQVFLDGRALFSQSSEGGVDWTTLGVALDDIERIEVFRGSNSATYGSDSFLGVVNIVTREPSQSAGLMAETRLGRHGVRDATLRFGSSHGDTDMRLSLSRHADDGPRENRLYVRRTNAVSLRADTKLTATDDLQVNLGLLDGALGVGGSSELVPRTEALRAAYIEAKFRRAMATDNEWSLTFVRSEDRAESSTSLRGPLTQPPYNLSATFDGARKSIRTELEFEQIFPVATAARLAWGMKLRSEDTIAPFYFSNPDAIHAVVGRLTANLEWRLSPKVLLNMGGSAERDRFTGNNFAPRAMLNFQVAPDHTLRAGVSRAHHLPATFEQKADLKYTAQTSQSQQDVLLLYPYLGTGEVKAEKMETREVSYAGILKSLRASVDVRAFDERASRSFVPISVPLPPENLSGLLNPFQIKSATGLYNGGGVRIRGIEYQIDQKPFLGTRLILSQSYVKINSDVGFTAKYDDRLAKSAPRLQTSLLLAQDFGQGTEASLVYQRVGSIYWVDAGSPTPSFRRADLRLAHAFRVNNTRMLAALTLQSFNGSYVERSSTALFVPQAFLTLRIEQ